MEIQNRLQNSPRESDQNDFLNRKQSQKLLFTNITAFIQMGGHKGEDPEIQQDYHDSLNLTENPLNTTEHSELFKKQFKRITSPRNPNRSKQLDWNTLDLKKDFCQNYQPNQTNQESLFDGNLENNQYPSIIQDHLAKLTYNGCDRNDQQDSNQSGQSELQQISPGFQKVSPTLSINKNLIKQKINDEKQSKYYSNRQSVIKLMKTPSITDFTDPKAKKRMTQILKNSIIEQSQNRILDDFEKGNKIIKKVLQNSLDRMQRMELHLKSFVQKLLHNSKIRNLNHLTVDAYLLIRDKSFIFKQTQTKHSRLVILLNNLLKKSQQWSFLKVFMPTTSYRLIWDAIQVCFTVLFLYFYSILIFFGQDYHLKSNALQYYFQFALYLFLGDMLINFNTAFFNKDIIVQDRKLIAKKYLKSQFFADAMSIIILSLKIIFNETAIAYNPNHDIIVYLKNILVFSKIFGLKQKSHMLQSVSALKDSQKHLLRLLTNIILVVLAAHIGIIFFIFQQKITQILSYFQQVSIIWYGLAIIESYQEFSITWIKKINIQNEQWYSKYIYSLYWSVTTMTTGKYFIYQKNLEFFISYKKVGYGDISASNEVEALFVSIVMIFMSCVFAYSINNIGIILQAIERDTQELTDNVTTIQRYLNRKNVNVELKSRIRHYLYFLAEEQKDRNKEVEDKVLEKLSNKLREEVTKEVNSRILKNYLIFTKQFSSETINRIVPIMKEVLVSPNEIIFKENQNDDNALYLIENGIIEIQHSKQGSDSSTVVVKTLSQNQLFGEISLFSGLSRMATARSVNLSTLYKITRQDLIDVLKQNQEDYQRFKMINEQIVFYKDYSALAIECYTCKKQGHISSICQLTHLNRDKQFISLKSQFSLFQQRQKSVRNRKKKQQFIFQFKLFKKSYLNVLDLKLFFNDQRRFSHFNKSELEEIKKKIFPDLIDDEDNSFENTRFGDAIRQDDIDDYNSNSNSSQSEESSESKNEEDYLHLSNIPEDKYQETEMRKEKNKSSNIQYSDIMLDKDQDNSSNEIKSNSKKSLALKVPSKEELVDKKKKYEDKYFLRKNKKYMTKLEQKTQKMESRLSMLESVLAQQPESLLFIRQQYNRKLSDKYERDASSIDKQINNYINMSKDKFMENDQQSQRFSMNQPLQIVDRENEGNLSLTAGDATSKRRETKKITVNSPFSRMVNAFQEHVNQDKEDSKNLKVSVKERGTIQNNLDPNFQSLVSYLSPQTIQQFGNDKIYQLNNPRNDSNYFHLSQNFLAAQNFKTFNDNDVDIMEYFDCQKEYSKFFPHNNLSKVLEKIKSQQINQRKSKIKSSPSKVITRFNQDMKAIKAVRRFNLLLMDEQKQNLFIHYNPTTISYGIGQKGQVPKYPIRKL